MEREKALDMALGQIEKQYGKGAVMRMDEQAKVKIATIPTGALSLDLALGIGGLPRGRVVEVYGPEGSGKTTVALHAIAEAQKAGGIAAFIDAEHALDPSYASALGVDIEALLVSQPDNGEQALEIADMLIRSNAIDILVVDSVAALTPRAEIEGEMGDSHVGLQARLMSQALRKLAGTLNRSRTCAVFVNQIREKIGVLFGCFSYCTRVTLADGTQEKIGKIVNQRMPVEVLSYDPDLGKIVPKRVVNWFDNGPTEEFLDVVVARGGQNGRAQFSCTPNHQVRTPGGWREAQELSVGDRVLQAVPHHLSDLQWEVLLGGLMGDSALSPTRSGHGARLRGGHGEQQTAYGDWKASLFANVGVSRTTNAKGAVFPDVQPMPELAELRDVVYIGGKKVLNHDYLKRLTPLSLAIWYMDDASLATRSKDGQRGRADVCVEAIEATSRTLLAGWLRDEWGIGSRLTERGGKAILQFRQDETEKLHALIAPYVHPSMEHKLLPRYRGQFAVEPQFDEMRYELLPMPIVSIAPKPRPTPDRVTRRYDLEVEGTHNYFADGVMVHNSPETQPGGRALKFYSSVRLDVRRIESLKDGTDFVGNRVRVKVVKNKCVAAGTRIFDPTTGASHAIEDIVDRGEGSAVWAADKRGELHVRPISARMDQGRQEVIGLALRDGTELRVTPDHRILTEVGWRVAGELAAGDRVARPRRSGNAGREAATEDPHGLLTVSQTEPVVDRLHQEGIAPSWVASVLGLRGHEARASMQSLLGGRRLRRNRVAALAQALDSAFLREVLADELFYDPIVTITPPRWERTFDLEVDELHNFVADDVVVHNCAPPFRQAEFDILFGEGISREGSVLDVGVDEGIVKKAGAWYTYDGEQLGQGRENARKFLKEHVDVAEEIYKKVTEALGLVPTDVTGTDGEETDLPGVPEK